MLPRDRTGRILATDPLLPNRVGSYACRPFRRGEDGHSLKSFIFRATETRCRPHVRVQQRSGQDLSPFGA